MNALNCYNKIAIILLIAILLAPISVFAADQCTEGVVTSNKTEFIEDAFRCDPKLTGLTYRVTECVKQILNNVAEHGFVEVQNGLRKAVFATLSMFVAFTGIKMILGGVRNLKGEFLVMLLKVVFVAYVVSPDTTGLKDINNMVQGFTSGLVDAVSSNVLSSGPCSVTIREVTSLPEKNVTTIETNLWKRLDCTILTFIGRNTRSPVSIMDYDRNGDTIISSDERDHEFSGTDLDKKWPIDTNGDRKIEDYEKQVTPVIQSAGGGGNCSKAGGRIEDVTLFEIAMSQLFTPYGIFVLALIAFATFILFLAFVKVLYIYILALIAVTFLMLAAPIFLPLFLFQKTKRMFDAWVKMIMGYMLQPALVTAFIGFFLAVTNVAIHGAYDAPLNPGDPPRLISPGLKQSLEKIEADMTANQCTRKTLLTMNNKIMAGQLDQVGTELDAIKKRLGDEVSAISVPNTPVDYTTLSVFIVQIIGCIVLLFIMMGLLANVADFVASLAGGVGSNLGKLGKGMSQLGGAARDAAQNITQK